MLESQLRDNSNSPTKGSDNTADLVQVENLQKSFGPKPVLRGVNL